MNVYLLNVGELIGGSREQFELLLGKLDETRRKKVLAAKTPQTRAAELGAGLLLQKAVRDWQTGRFEGRSEESGEKEQAAVFAERSPCLGFCTVSDLCEEPRESIPVSYRYGEKGKPYFADLPLFFSLSHSGDYVLLAVAGGEIGADIQKLQPVDVRKLAGRFFSEPERLILEHCESDGERQRLFFELWTRKEACGKLTGTGVAAMLGEDMTAVNQRPRSKLTGYQSCSAAKRNASSMHGVFDSRGIRQMDADASDWLIARGNKRESVEWMVFSPPEGYTAAICRFRDNE